MARLWACNEYFNTTDERVSYKMKINNTEKTKERQDKGSKAEKGVRGTKSETRVLLLCMAVHNLLPLRWALVLGPANALYTLLLFVFVFNYY